MLEGMCLAATLLYKKNGYETMKQPWRMKSPESFLTIILETFKTLYEGSNMRQWPFRCHQNSQEHKAQILSKIFYNWLII